MANQKDGSGPFRVSAKYGEWLYDELDKLRLAGESDHDLAKRAGTSRTTLWRLKDGDGTVAAATKLRDFIAQHGGSRLPDPAEPFDADGDPEWAMIGRELRERWPQEYGQLKRLLGRRLAAKVLLDEVDAEIALILGKSHHHT